MMEKEKKILRGQYSVTYRNRAGVTWVAQVEADSEESAKRKIERYPGGLQVIQVKFIRGSEKRYYRYDLVDANIHSLIISDFVARSDEEAISIAKEAYEEDPSALGLFIYKFEGYDTCGPLKEFFTLGVASR